MTIRQGKQAWGIAITAIILLTICIALVLPVFAQSGSGGSLTVTQQATTPDPVPIKANCSTSLSAELPANVTSTEAMSPYNSWKWTITSITLSSTNNSSPINTPDSNIGFATTANGVPQSSLTGPGLLNAYLVGSLPKPGYWTVTVQAAFTITSTDQTYTGTLPVKITAYELKLAPASKTLFVDRVDNTTPSNDPPLGLAGYADIHASGKNFVKLNISVLPTDLSLSNAKLTMQYPGAGALPSYAGTALGNGVDGFAYQDYSAAKQGTMRIWNIQHRGDIKGPTATLQPSYLVPGTAYPTSGSSSDLRFSTDNKTTFYMEGINGATNQTITGTLLFSSGYSGYSDSSGSGGGSSSGTANGSVSKVTDLNVYDVKLGVNCNNHDTAHIKLFEGTPGTSWTINHQDYIIQNENKGFVFWWTDDSGQTIHHANIVDLAPVQLIVPQQAAGGGFSYYMTAQAIGGGNAPVVYIYRSAVAAPANPSSFLQKVSTADSQLSLSASGFLLPNSYSVGEQALTLSPQSGVTQFLVKAISPSGVNPLTTVRFQVLAQGPGMAKPVPVDSARITFKDPGGFWNYLSARTSLTQNYNVPLDHGSVSVNCYADAVTPSGYETSPSNPNIKKYLLFIHGYNTSANGAYADSNYFFKELYWNGFRGNFVSLDWIGDEFAPLFDNNVHNVFRTAPAALHLIQKLDAAAGDSQNVDVAAHSLGNLLVFETMRLNTWAGGGPLMQNFLSIEAAVWREAFQPAGSLRYTTHPDKYAYVANTDRDKITYTYRQLKTMSWRSWFEQPGHVAPKSVSGTIYHSYNRDDEPLTYFMRLNDWTFRSVGEQHYYRPFRSHNRTVVDNNIETNLFPPLVVRGAYRMDHEPALMQIRDLFYDYKNLDIPDGAIPSDMPSNGIPKVISLDAHSLGWLPKDHSDFLIPYNGSTTSPMWLPVIWPWFQNVADPAVPIGVQK
ncbi:MAG: hypothetical protein ACP5O1_10910 [Phycisphaerae bacterium]